MLWECDGTCLTCDGPDANNCVSCMTTKFLKDGKCEDCEVYHRASEDEYNEFEKNYFLKNNFLWSNW